MICQDPKDRFKQEDVQEYLRGINLLLDTASKKGIEEYNAVERELCKSDLYYLGLFVLGISKMYSEEVDGETVYHPWIFNRCKEVEASPDYHIDIWAREHFKSTIITMLKSVQDILCNPEIAICIYSYNATIARKFVRQIREALENPRLKELFPDIIPEDTKMGKYRTTNEYGKEQWKKFQWSDENFTVKRTTGRKEPTVSGYGLVTGQPTGMHFDILVYDDCVTPDSVRTQMQNEKTTEQWKMSLNTGSGENVKVRIIGTRYAERDTYFHIMNPAYQETGELGGSRFHERIKPCMTEDGTTVLYSKEYIENKKKTMVGFVFYAQMMCDPKMSASFRFDENWIVKEKYEDLYNNRGNCNWYIFVDPANTKSKRSDYTAMVVIGARSDGKLLLADGIRDKLSLSERIEAIFYLVKKWSYNLKMPMVFWEQSGLLTDMESIRKEMENKSFYFQLKAVTTKPRIYIDARMNTGGSMKDARIYALEPLFRGYGIVLADHAYQFSYEGKQYDFIQKFIDDEYSKYPFVDHDDMLDALSRCVDAESGTLIIFPSYKTDPRFIQKKKVSNLDFTDVRYEEFVPF